VTTNCRRVVIYDVHQSLDDNCLLTIR